MRRRSLLALIPPSLVGCAAREFCPLEFPAPVQLQDPLPGQAIVYLLRAPHDAVSLSISVAGRLLAELPPSTYTFASLPPGEHALVAARHGEAASPSRLTVSAGERRFFYTSVPSETSNTFLLVPFGAGVLPLFGRTRSPSGSRAWCECNEADAQGLISISRLVLPVQNAVA
jgi:hypothetical protein